MTLYYADDTIILADSAIELQAALEELFEYCKKWKLVVNEGKTKVLCITGQRLQNLTFYYNDKELEVVNEFVYLGITFSQKGIGMPAIKARELSGKKSMFSVLTKCKVNNLPVDLSIDLFEKMVIPTLIYGAEIWGFGNLLSLERIQLKFAKYLLKLKRNTANKMIYGETGLYPIEFYINMRIISFWVKLITGKQDKISYKLYSMCLTLNSHRRLECKWLQKVQNLLNRTGFSFVFEEQKQLEKEWLKQSFLPNIKQVMKDQITQEWLGQVTLESEKCFHYKNFGLEYEVKKYFEILVPSLWIPFCRFRTGNHKFPVEIYSWTKLHKERNERTCTICDSGAIGDEYHYLMICPIFQELREEYLPNYYLNRPTLTKFYKLMKTEKKTLLIKVAKLVKEILVFFP